MIRFVATTPVTDRSPLPALPLQANKPSVLRIAALVNVGLQKQGCFGEDLVAKLQLLAVEVEILHELLRRMTTNGPGGAALRLCWKGLVPRLHAEDLHSCVRCGRGMSLERSSWYGRVRSGLAAVERGECQRSGVFRPHWCRLCSPRLASRRQVIRQKASLGTTSPGVGLFRPPTVCVAMGKLLLGTFHPRWAIAAHCREDFARRSRRNRRIALHAATKLQVRAQPSCKQLHTRRVLMRRRLVGLRLALVSVRWQCSKCFVLDHECRAA